MDDNNGCGCYLILMGIGLLGWIVSGISEDNSGRMTRGQILSHATRISKKISTKMRSSSSLLGRI
mgnify:CR=1 FL=1